MRVWQKFLWGMLVCYLAACTTQVTPTPTPIVIIATMGPRPNSTARPSQTEIIAVRRPAPRSALLSPLEISGIGAGTTSLYARLITEDAILFEGPITNTQTLGTDRVTFKTEITFTVAVDTPGRVYVYSVGDLDGGLTHLTSVEVILLAPGGRPTNRTANDLQEALMFLEPPSSPFIKGGQITVQGLTQDETVTEIKLCGLAAFSEDNDPFTDPVCGRAANVLATGTVELNPPPALSRSFTANLTYSVTKPIQARIVLYTHAPSDSTVTHATSTDVIVQP